MRAQAQRMNAIIADLLELSRLESADGEAARDPIDVPRMLERLQRDALVSADRPRQVLLQLDTSDGLYGSGHEIESAFTNLLVNAIKYTNQEGTVRMRWWTDVEGAYFSVIDSGIGIPAEHIPRLTERFYRVDAGRSRGQGGSGAGPGHRQARLAAPWWMAGRTKRRGQGQHFHLSFSRAAHLAARGEKRRERMKVTNLVYTVDVRRNRM